MHGSIFNSFETDLGVPYLPLRIPRIREQGEAEFDDGSPSSSSVFTDAGLVTQHGGVLTSPRDKLGGYHSKHVRLFPPESKVLKSKSVPGNRRKNNLPWQESNPN